MPCGTVDSRDYFSIAFRQRGQVCLIHTAFEHDLAHAVELRHWEMDMHDVALHVVRRMQHAFGYVWISVKNVRSDTCCDTQWPIAYDVFHTVEGQGS